MAGVKPSAWSTDTINTIAGRVRQEVFRGVGNIDRYVDTYADLPLGTSDSDPEIGDLVGVTTATGAWYTFNLKEAGFYRRVALTGVAATDYGTKPYTGFNPFAVLQVTGIILASGSWSLVGDYYEYTYLNDLITSNTIVEFIPDNEVSDIVIAAEMLPATASATGSVKFYAKSAPTSAITGTINLTTKA